MILVRLKQVCLFVCGFAYAPNQLGNYVQTFLASTLFLDFSLSAAFEKLSHS